MPFLWKIVILCQYNSAHLKSFDFQHVVSLFYENIPLLTFLYVNLKQTCLACTEFCFYYYCISLCFLLCFLCISWLAAVDLNLFLFFCLFVLFCCQESYGHQVGGDLVYINKCKWEEKTVTMQLMSSKWKDYFVWNRLFFFKTFFCFFGQVC